MEIFLFPSSSWEGKAERNFCPLVQNALFPSPLRAMFDHSPHGVVVIIFFDRSLLIWYEPLSSYLPLHSVSSVQHPFSGVSQGEFNASFTVKNEISHTRVFIFHIAIRAWRSLLLRATFTTIDWKNVIGIRYLSLVVSFCRTFFLFPSISCNCKAAGSCFDLRQTAWLKSYGTRKVCLHDRLVCLISRIATSRLYARR